MNWPWPFPVAFLGAGGDKPRLESLSGDSGVTQRLLDLPASQSVYAIDIEFEDGKLAAGTKGGLVYIRDGNKSPGTVAPRKLVQGAPVLSLSWISRSDLVVSDTAKRCLIWDTNQESSPRPIETRGETICSLLLLPDGQLAGLSGSGKFLFWQSLEGRLVREIAAPPPPPMSALVRVIHWPAEHALAFPSREGDLILYDLERGGVRRVEAHEGPFYAIAVQGESLLTVGMQDGQLKVWEPGFGKPAVDFQVPKEVISAGVLSCQPTKMVLVGANGRGTLYTLDGKPRSVSQLPGEDYRVIVVPAPERIQAIAAQRRDAEVRRIVSQIQNGMGRLAEDEVAGLHSQLTGLGYVHVSLALRAEQAYRKGDIIETLRFYTLLMKILPQGKVNVAALMEKYGDLLEKTWHISEAHEFCRRIVDIDPDYRFHLHRNNLAEAARLLKDENWVIEPDIPIDDIIKSATLIGKLFYGRYVIKELGAASCGGVRLTPELIADKYGRVRSGPQWGEFPAATAEQVWWISKRGCDRIQLVSFGEGATNDIRGLQFAIKVSLGELDTVVSRVVLFDWRKVLPGDFPEAGNGKAMEALTRIHDKASYIPYLDAVGKAVQEALRRLITENRRQEVF